MAAKLFLLFSFLTLFLVPSLGQLGLLGLPPCLTSLMPCMDYLHGDLPPPSCCLPLESALEEEADCLCTAFQDPLMLAQVNMTQEQMLNFPSKCQIDLPKNNCTTDATDGSPAPSQQPTSSKRTPSPPPPSEHFEKSRALDKTPEDTINLLLAMVLPLLTMYRL